MIIALHPNAHTIPAVRAEIAASSDSVAVLAALLLAAGLALCLLLWANYSFYVRPPAMAGARIPKKRRIVSGSVFAQARAGRIAVEKAGGKCELLRRGCNGRGGCALSTLSIPRMWSAFFLVALAALKAGRTRRIASHE